MGYRILADLIVALHAGWVGFVVFGQLAILIGLALDGDGRGASP